MIRKGDRTMPMVGFKAKKVAKAMNPLIYILACDPSMTGFGWVVLNQWGVVITSRTIKTEKLAGKLRIRKGDDDTRRITEIATELNRVLKSYDIRYIVSELPHGSQSAVSATMLGYSIATICALSVAKDIPIEWYSEGDCKKAAANKTSVPKEEMIQLMGIKFPSMNFTGTKYMDEGTADALAVFVAATKHSETLKFMQQ